jgi:hypothetical protein
MSNSDRPHDHVRRVVMGDGVCESGFRQSAQSVGLGTPEHLRCCHGRSHAAWLGGCHSTIRGMRNVAIPWRAVNPPNQPVKSINYCDLATEL